MPEYEEGILLMFKTTIQEILKDYKEHGERITQNDLANVLGMTKQSFSNKMNRDSFTVEDMVKIASFLDMQVILKKDENEYMVK